MISNMFKDKVQIIKKTKTLGATGESITYSPVETRWGRVIPLDAKTRLDYQQFNSIVTHNVVFRNSVSLTMGDYEFRWKDKTLTPVEPPMSFVDGYVVACKES